MGRQRPPSPALCSRRPASKLYPAYNSGSWSCHPRAPADPTPRTPPPSPPSPSEPCPPSPRPADLWCFAAYTEPASQGGISGSHLHGNTRHPRRTAGLLCAARLGHLGRGDTHAPAQAKTGSSLVHPLPAPRGRALVCVWRGGVYTSGRGCAQVCVCVCPVGAGAVIRSPGAAGSASLCVLCVGLCLTMCLRPSGFGHCLWVCVSGRGWEGPVPLPVCARDSGTAAPLTATAQWQEKDPSSGLFTRKSGAPQGPAGAPTGHLCCALPRAGSSSTDTRCWSLALRLHTVLS